MTTAPYSINPRSLLDIPTSDSFSRDRGIAPEFVKTRVFSADLSVDDLPEGYYFDFLTEAPTVTKDAIHPADKDFVISARKALKKKIQASVHGKNFLMASMQFRVVAHSGKMRLINHVLSPIAQLNEEMLEVLVTETDLSSFATNPVKTVRLLNQNGDEDATILKVEGFEIEDECCPFSDRQLQILRLLAEGNKTAQISETLFISVDTVRTHRQHILQRSAHSNMTATVVDCVRKGWI